MTMKLSDSQPKGSVKRARDELTAPRMLPTHRSSVSSKGVVALPSPSFKFTVVSKRVERFVTMFRAQSVSSFGSP